MSQLKDLLWESIWESKIDPNTLWQRCQDAINITELFRLVLERLGHQFWSTYLHRRVLIWRVTTTTVTKSKSLKTPVFTMKSHVGLLESTWTKLARTLFFWVGDWCSSKRVFGAPLGRHVGRKDFYVYSSTTYHRHRNHTAVSDAKCCMYVDMADTMIHGTSEFQVEENK